jgi:hypothetical protein
VIRRGIPSKEIAMHQAKGFLAGIISLLCAQLAGAAEGDGLTANPDNLSWTRWQGRVSLGGSLPPWHADLVNGETMGLKVDSVSLMGDYYLSRSLVGHGSNTGFRTTGGVIYGPRAQLTGSRPMIGSQRSAFSVERHPVGAVDGTDGSSDIATLPYLGIGYTGASLKGGWSFSADLGMLALSPGNSVKLGKVVGGTQLDDMLRDMRLAPVLQVGVSYSF